MKPSAILGLTGLLLAGCATAGPGVPQPAAASAQGGICRNTALAQFAGQAETGELGTRILRASGAKTLQWVPAGTMVTMDFWEDRVRVALDERNRVQRVSCG